jgi:energy-coupling factor transporter ATP-binding protein EcfA2
MKIIKLTAENVMKLSAVEIVPQDNLILITGENGAGKSSVLDSIVMALCGKSTIPDKPIKDGADKGKIVVELEDYRIERSFTQGNSYLKIENSNGSTVKSPQKFLDELIGKISFDPLEFMNQKPDDQAEIFLSLIGVDVKTLDAEEATLREERTMVGRDLKKSEVFISNNPFFTEVMNVEEQSIGELSSLLTSSIQYNQDWDRDFGENEGLKLKGAACRARIDQIQEEIEKLTNEAKSLDIEIDDLKTTYRTNRDHLDAYPKRDISELQKKMSTFEEVNEKVRSNRTHLEIAEEIKEIKGQYELLTRQIQAVDDKRKLLLSSAPMPVPGLSFESGKITFNGIPLAQCSDGEKLMISLGISMALNPTLRVLRIKDGSLLDEKNRKIIYDRIKDKDFQLWMESVSSDKSVGIFIEDGAVVAIDGQAVTPPVARKTRAGKSKVPETEATGPKGPSLTSPPLAPEVNAPAAAPPPPEDW